jgi:hypothetical protein
MLPSVISIGSARPAREAFPAFGAGQTTAGTKPLLSSQDSAKCPSFADRIQFDRCCGTRSCRRATSAPTPHDPRLQLATNPPHIVINVDHIVSVVLRPRP